MEEIALTPQRGKWLVEYIVDNHIKMSTKDKNFPVDMSGYPVPVVADEYFFEHPEIIRVTEDMKKHFGNIKVRFNY